MGEGERPAIVTCASCSAENATGRRFCDQCGTSLETGCPNCGSENRPEARFCGDCGQALAPAAQPVATTTAPAPTSAPEGGAERRLVSVLFADLVAFTDYSEDRDSELVRETLSRYHRASREVIERHGGSVEKFIGDAVMAVWGAPRANEDDAERAVRAALEVIGAIDGLEEGLRARVAVLTGQAAVSLGATDEGMVAGDLVNTAARLQAVAAPNTVLVGEATMQAASGAIAFEEVGEHVLKGKAVPVSAWRALRVVADASRNRSEGLEPPFVGRDLELRLLKDLVNTARVERRPRLVSITGPAGIGKSRLAWEFEKYVDGLVETIYWHRGRSPSYGEGIAFWALGEMVRRRAHLVESDDEATTRERVRMVVAEFVEPAEAEWVEGALLTLLGLEPPPPGGRDALFAAWRTFFERVAAQSTTVLIFEDLHWADDGQLDFIDHLLEWTRDVPLLVITLARPDLLERRPGWGTSARSFNAIGLEPLTDADMRGLLTGLVPGMPESAVEQVLARADGIPLYAVEMVRTLISDGRLEPLADGTLKLTGELGELALPDSLRALVAARLDALDAADRALVQDATVLGQAFDHRALAAITEQEEDAVEARLRTLVKRELLEMLVDPGSPERGQFSFVQSVIREVAYDTFSRHDRRARHVAAARYYEAIGDEELAAVLATHYVAAFEASDEGPEAEALQSRARLALRAAADRALDLGSPDQALAHLEAALEVTTDATERAELLDVAVRAATASAVPARAVEYARAAAAAHEVGGDRRSALAAAGVLGRALLDAGSVEEATALLERSIADAEAYPEVQARLLASAARAYMRLARGQAAVEAADRSIALAEPLMLDPVMAEALANKGAALQVLGRLVEPRLLLGEAANLAHKAGDFDLELRARSNLSVFLAMQDLPAAMDMFAESVKLAERLGSLNDLIGLKAHIHLYAILEGLDWTAPRQGFDALLEEVSDPVARGDLLASLLQLQVRSGEDAAVTFAELDQLAKVHRDLENEALANLLRAYSLLYEGRPTDAVPLIREVLPESVQFRILGEYLLLHLGCVLGDVEVVREAEGLIRASALFSNVAMAIKHAAAAALAALEGRTAEAADGFRAAVESFRLAGWLYEVAVVQTMALSVMPDEPAIEGWAEEARERFERLGSKPNLRLLDEALERRTAVSVGSDG